MSDALSFLGRFRNWSFEAWRTSFAPPLDDKKRGQQLCNFGVTGVLLVVQWNKRRLQERRWGGEL